MIESPVVCQIVMILDNEDDSKFPPGSPSYLSKEYTDIVDTCR